MAISEPYSGTQTAVIGTEHVLNTTTPETTDGIYQFFIDVSAMVAGDVLELRAKEKAIATGTIRLIKAWTLANAQTEPLFASPTFIFLHGWDVTLKQTAGTGRAFPFSIRKVA